MGAVCKVHYGAVKSENKDGGCMYVLDNHGRRKPNQTGKRVGDTSDRAMVERVVKFQSLYILLQDVNGVKKKGVF